MGSGKSLGGAETPSSAYGIPSADRLLLHPVAQQKRIFPVQRDYREEPVGCRRPNMQMIDAQHDEIDVLGGHAVDIACARGGGANITDVEIPE